MTTNRKLLLIITVLSLLIVGVGAVGAQNMPGGSGGQGGPGGNMFGDHGPGGRPGGPGGRQNRPLHELIEIVADETGLDVVEIRQQVRDGLTLAEIITSSGGDVDVVIDQVVTVLTEDINQAVADGRITQEWADQMLTNLEETVTNVMNGDFPAGRPMQFIVSRAVIRLAADETGLDTMTIVEELRSGKSLADILTENDVDVNAFIETAVQQVDERLDQAVENGRITQEQADERLQTFRDNLTEHIYQSGTAESAV